MQGPLLCTLSTLSCYLKQVQQKATENLCNFFKGMAYVYPTLLNPRHGRVAELALLNICSQLYFGHLQFPADPTGSSPSLSLLLVNQCVTLHMQRQLSPSSHPFFVHLRFHKTKVPNPSICMELRLL